MTFENFMEMYQPQSGGARMLMKEKSIRAMMEEVWVIGADWWIFGADMWLEEGQDHPVPDTWQDAESAMWDNPTFPTVDEWDSPAYKVRNMLYEYDETGLGDDLVTLIDDALAAGAYEGWKLALEAQDRYYAENENA